MEEPQKLPLKRVELSLTKFNEVAIPHHLDLLRQHRANIIKYSSTGELTRVQAEQAHARRVASQLRSLLREMEALRARLLPADLAAFDRRTQRARDTTHTAIMEYLESAAPVSAPLPAPLPAGPAPAPLSCSAVSTDSVGLAAHQDRTLAEDVPLLQLQSEDPPASCEAQSLGAREATLRGWQELQREVCALHEVWQHTQRAVVQQRDLVHGAHDLVLRADLNVADGRHALQQAHRSRSAWYPVAGMVAGGALCGPLGLVLGAKVGAAAAVLGSLLGYTGVCAVLHAPAAPTAPEAPSTPGTKED